MAFAFYRSVTVGASQVPSTQTNFPALFSFTNASFKIVGSGGKIQNADGVKPADFAFYADSGLSSLLKYEIEQWDQTAGTIIAWVKIPSIADGTVFYVGYGDTTRTTSQDDASNVWDANFVAVYHLPNGTTLTATDSTSSGLNGTLVNAPTAATGQIDGAATFNGTNQRVTTSAYNFTSGAITVEAWVKRPWTTGKYAPIWVENYGALVGIGMLTTGSAVFDWQNKDILMVGHGYDNSGTVQDPRAIASYGTLTDNTWHYLAGAMSASVAQVYLDGTALSMRVSRTAAVTTVNTGTQFGGSVGTGDWMDGTIDELRISKVVRSADWILASYRNQSAPGTFLALGTETLLGVHHLALTGVGT